MQPSPSIPRPAALAGLSVLVVGLALLAVLASGMLDARADSGGPGGGYTWFDNNDPAPKVDYNWITALAPGATAVGGDDNASTMDLPFTFNFFGEDYTQVDVSSNGFISFDIGNDCNENYNDFDGDLGQTIPATGDCDDTGWGGEPLIAGWFDDLDPGECGIVIANTSGEAPNRVFVVEYFDTCHNDCEDCAAGEGVTYEILLFEGSNNVKLQYQDTYFGDADEDLVEENNGGTATAGIAGDSFNGLQYSANQTRLTDGLAVLFTTGGLPTPSPEPTPEPEPPIQGDADCDGDSDATDALKILQKNAGIPYSQNEPCANIGDPIE